jgi:hypothetical protein
MEFRYPRMTGRSGTQSDKKKAFQVPSQFLTPVSLLESKLGFKIVMEIVNAGK